MSLYKTEKQSEIYYRFRLLVSFLNCFCLGWALQGMEKLKVSLLVSQLAQQNFSCGETTAQGCISERNITRGHIEFISAKVVDSSNPASSDFYYN